jgi:inner membrane protein
MSEQLNNPNPTPSFWSNLFNSATFRMFIVGFLVLILLIPLFFVQNLIREREGTKDKAVSEINNDWGEKIMLYGPILKVPYRVTVRTTETDVKTGKSVTVSKNDTYFAYFFPENLSIDGILDAQPKKRGIYQTSVYQTQMKLEGNFKKPDFKKLEIDSDAVDWSKAQILFQTTNVKGITSQLALKLDDKNLSFSTLFDTENTDETVYVDNESLQKYTLASDVFAFDNGKENYNFSMDFKANGSESFQIIPVGKTTKMHLKSAWKDSNFFGEYLPQNPDKLTKNGFDAHWQVLEMNRPFSQQFKSIPNLEHYAFGVNLMIPVDNYLQNERSAKYGFLVIGLTFLLFFLFQTLSKINIHPFQYLLIGLALVIFYTLLLSISEHSNFTTAYIVSAIATIILITLFSKSIMKTWKFPLFVLIALTALYTFIYVIIQLESYALLVGSFGLFGILAGVMYASRKIEWN